MVIYEIISSLVFLVALVWVYRTRNPFYLAALVSGFFLFVFDWLWCGRDFFNATFNQELTMVPGIDVLEQRYPWAVAFNWSVGFGLVPLLLSKYHGSWSAKLGALHFPVVLAVSAVADIAIEVSLVTGLGVYTYHQAPEYLIWGVPWSNLWFGGGLMALPYFAFHYCQKWTDLPPDAGFSLSQESTWKAFFMATAALWVSFFALTIPQIFWYAFATPWIDSGRLF
jgi:hypothetical protein